MVATTSARDRLVSATIEQLTLQGYAGTSVKTICSSSEATIGSLYHHFPGGKDELVAVALRAAGEENLTRFYRHFLPAPDLASGARAFFTAAATDLVAANWRQPCPVASVAAEVSSSHPALRDVCADIINGWIEAGTSQFTERGLADDRARTAVVLALTTLEGAFILARTMRSTKPLEDAGELLANLLSGGSQ